jgi:hypothetical protein
MDICLSAARAAASRRNGARSRGPKTPEGKARSAQNALKHGFRTQAHIVLPREDAAGFAALEAALAVELAPEGALQSVLVHRIACATWRLDRADRLEVEVFARQSYGNAGLGLALIRDGNGTRSIETLMRYRGAAMAELMRALRVLKALQAEAAEPQKMREAAPALPAPTQEEMPIEPEARENPGEHAPASQADQPELRGEPDARRAPPGPACDRVAQPVARSTPGKRTAVM